MKTNKTSRNKPIFKKFVRLKKILIATKKFLNFKKRKWSMLINQQKKLSKTNKRFSYYKFYDQMGYKVNKFNSYFSQSFKNNSITKKGFNLYYGSLKRLYLKTIVRKLNKKANKIKNKVTTKSLLLEKLENRLDIILVRSKFVLNVYNARQIIAHGHVKINGKRVTNSSFILKPGDVVTFSKKIHKLLVFFLLHSDVWPLPPKNLQISYKLFKLCLLDTGILNNSSEMFNTYLNYTIFIKYYKK